MRLRLYVARAYRLGDTLLADLSALLQADTASLCFLGNRDDDGHSFVFLVWGYFILYVKFLSSFLSYNVLYGLLVLSRVGAIATETMDNFSAMFSLLMDASCLSNLRLCFFTAYNTCKKSSVHTYYHPIFSGELALPG